MTSYRGRLVLAAAAWDSIRALVSRLKTFRTVAMLSEEAALSLQQQRWFSVQIDLDEGDAQHGWDARLTVLVEGAPGTEEIGPGVEILILEGPKLFAHMLISGPAV